jgi:Pentapeptide repeats (8 copies)
MPGVTTVKELLYHYANGERSFEGSNLRKAELRDVDLRNVSLRGANLYRADLGGANLDETDLRDTGLQWARLRWTSLVDADLRGAYLQGADLCKANLYGAHLCDVDLREADISKACFTDGQWAIQGPARSDGYLFYLTHLEGEGTRVRAGCHNLTVEDAVDHWKSGYRAGTSLGNESLLIIKQLLALAKERGLL